MGCETLRCGYWSDFVRHEGSPGCVRTRSTWDAINGRGQPRDETDAPRQPWGTGGIFGRAQVLCGRGEYEVSKMALSKAFED